MWHILNKNKEIFKIFWRQTFLGMKANNKPMKMRLMKNNSALEYKNNYNKDILSNPVNKKTV